MRKLIQSLRSRVGDFWWYTFLLFMAARAGDVLNALVGLWLVPKYVDPAELGAVMPLARYADFLAIPIAVFASTFRNETSRLAVANEFGKLKALMRGVFIATAVFMIAAVLVSRIVLPHFLERIRIVEGSLGYLILFASFIGAVHPIFNNALQALKKFNACAVIGVVSAPVRFLTMLVAMPFRALSGYFVGQCATPVFGIAASVVALRKELAVKAEPYWTRDVVKRFAALFGIFAATAIAGGIYSLVESTVIRQRMPDLDSAGYYMATRFSEIAAFLAQTLSFTIFPFAADMAAAGRKTWGLVAKSMLAVVAFSVLVALPFFFFGETILGVLPHGEEYAAYWWTIPWLIGIGILSAFTGLYSMAEISANRFGYLKWMIPLDVAGAALLLAITGYGYFTAYIPASWSAFLETHNILDLGAMLWWMTFFNSVKAAFCLAAMLKDGTKHGLADNT